MSRKIGAAEFKTHCLRILDEVERSGESVTVTKRGRVVAEVKAVKKKERRSIIGAMRGSVIRIGDIVSPAYERRWDAELGVWEPE